ncbi:MAG: ATP-binding protein [Endomicrobium sp.]|nr:ATP-binding protein [Endomicrobium sp.]
MKTFDKDSFLGFVSKIEAGYIDIYFPSSEVFNKGRGQVGGFVVIDGGQFGFLARMDSLNLHKQENEIIKDSSSQFSVSGRAEILLVFETKNPDNVQKTAFQYPNIGAQVFSCSDEQIQKYIESFGKKTPQEICIPLGAFVSSGSIKCNISLNALFQRHCAVVGTTGGGKSWTLAKLMESVSKNSKTKMILFDAAGEYGSLKTKSLVLGEDSYFPYQKLSIPDLFILLRPQGESQKPTLLEAIRSLKIAKLSQKGDIFKKAYNPRKEYNDLYRQYCVDIENNLCDFEISNLIAQIKEECVLYFADAWGAADIKLYDLQASLINKIANMLNTALFNKLFGFKDIPQNFVSIIYAIEKFLAPSQKEDNILRINLENVSSSFSAKEILANAIGSYLLNKARNRDFKENPIILFIDEAHQFLNRKSNIDNADYQPLEAFDLIAKECRKFGLFLCLATQMPRDIPEGALSQIGTFIVHRLINERDKAVIENAASSAGKDILSFLPSLGAGEALLIGIDFQMPLLLKIDKPQNPPHSDTPILKS